MEVNPFPRISDMMSQWSEGKIFPKLDVNSGLWQVVLDHKHTLQYLCLGLKMQTTTW